MDKEDTIDIVFLEECEPDFDNNMFPRLKDIKSTVHKIEKESISDSLNEFISDLGEIIQNIDSLPYSRTELEQISIAAEITKEGGISWIANANTGISNSIVLTFRIKKSE